MGQAIKLEKQDKSLELKRKEKKMGHGAYHAFSSSQTQAPRYALSGLLLMMLVFKTILVHLGLCNQQKCEVSLICVHFGSE